MSCRMNHSRKGVSAKPPRIVSSRGGVRQIAQKWRSRAFRNRQLLYLVWKEPPAGSRSFRLSRSDSAAAGTECIRYTSRTQGRRAPPRNGRKQQQYPSCCGLHDELPRRELDHVSSSCRPPAPTGAYWCARRTTGDIQRSSTVAGNT